MLLDEDELMPMIILSQKQHFLTHKEFVTVIVNHILSEQKVDTMLSV